GDFAQRVTIHTTDEVGALAMALNHMAIQVQGHIEHLEELVQLRTQELAFAKERVETILNHSVDGIFLVHDDLRIQQTNAAFNQLFNCEGDVYFNQSLLDLIVEPDVQQVQQVI